MYYKSRKVRGNDYFTIFLFLLSIFWYQGSTFLGLSISTWILILMVMINIKLISVTKFYFLFLIFLSTTFGSILNSTVIPNLISWFRLLLILFSIEIILNQKRRNPSLIDNCVSLVFFITLFLTVLAFLGINLYNSHVGERAGFLRPFLFSSPIDISTMLAGISIYYERQKKNKALSLLSLLNLLVFQSATGLTVYISGKKRFFLLLLICVPIIVLSVLIIDISSVGSFVIRFQILIDSLIEFFKSPIYIQLFGVGLRGLPIVGDDLFQLRIYSDMTLYVRLLFETGYIGLISFFIIMLKVYNNNKILARMILVFGLSVDQLFYYWVLPFLVISVDDKKESN